MASRRNGGLRAVATVTAPVRCAVYTRKSTERGLDADFTSLDNQRQVCVRFVEQMHGAVHLPTRYDDGGYSGGTTDRPALQRLLSDIRDGNVDCVVAYKYDRLGRSMIDCLRIFELMDKHGVRFISVTQQIDTSTSHGRMFMNNLLSHAQFERDLISERTRDKMRAARRRGKWTGGMPPLGFDVAPEGGRLMVNQVEAEQVRAIFALYVETPSLVRVSQDLNRRGWRRKSWTTREGKRRESVRWDRVSLVRLLKDPINVGKQKLGDEVFPGEHQGIVPKGLFDKVQELIGENRRTGGASARNRHGFMLRGLLRCTACDAAMVPHPAKAHGRLYKYYTCCAAQRRGHGTCPTRSVSADKVETFVVDQIRRLGANSELQEETFRQATLQVKARRRGLKLESKRLTDDLVRARAEVERLVGTVSRITGPAADAVAAELAKAQERVQTLEARQAEVAAELTSVAAQDIDREAVARALAEFDPIWEVLLTPERERVLRLLIERVDYRGDTGELAITWRMAGFGQLAAEVAP